MVERGLEALFGFFGRDDQWAQVSPEKTRDFVPEAARHEGEVVALAPTGKRREGGEGESNSVSDDLVCVWVPTARRHACMCGRESEFDPRTPSYGSG